jgi:hypothetical protein
MIKDVLVNLAVGAKRDAAAQYGAAVAAELEAHACAVAFAWEPVIPATVMGGMVSVDIIEAQRAENEKAAKAAAAAFDALAKRNGLSVETHVITSTAAGAADTFGRMGRRFDLSIACQADPDVISPVEDMIIEAAMFQSGRPVIVVPYIHQGGLKLDRVMVCWDGGRAAARAVGDAMPLLARAKAVDVVTVTGAPSPQGGRETHLPCRQRRRGHAAVLRGRYQRRHDRDGRLRPLAPARVHSRRRNAQHAQVNDGAVLDVALTRSPAGAKRGLGNCAASNTAPIRYAWSAASCSNASPNRACACTFSLVAPSDA